MNRSFAFLLSVCLLGLIVLTAVVSCSGDKNSPSSNSSGISDFMQVGKQYLLSGYSATTDTSAVVKVLEIRGDWIRVEIISSGMMLYNFERTEDYWDDLWVNSHQIHMIATNPKGERW